MANVNSNYRKNIKTLLKFVSGSVKSNKNRIETSVDDSGNAFSELDIQSFDNSWKEKAARSVKPFESKNKFG